MCRVIVPLYKPGTRGTKYLRGFVPPNEEEVQQFGQVVWTSTRGGGIVLSQVVCNPHRCIFCTGGAVTRGHLNPLRGLGGGTNAL